MPSQFALGRMAFATVTLLLAIGTISPAVGVATATPSCGMLNATCGLAAKAKGCTPGVCKSGYFCMRNFKTGNIPKCQPVPAKCGLAYQPACPPNAKQPFTSRQQALSAKPYCKDGSYAFYANWINQVDPKDFYGDGALQGACVPVDPNCGTAPGKACCPFLYHQATNPPLPTKMPQGCLGDNPNPDHPSTFWYCKGNATSPITQVYANQALGYWAGTCVANAKDCGKLGKSCCLLQGGAANSNLCTDANTTCDLSDTMKYYTGVCKKAGPAGRRFSL